MAPTSVESVELTVWVSANSDGLPSACASLATVCNAVEMFVSCVFIAVSPDTWFWTLVTCCWSEAIRAWTIELVSRPEASPVTCIAVPLPSDVNWSPVEYALELVAELLVLVLIDEVDMIFVLYSAG